MVLVMVLLPAGLRGSQVQLAPPMMFDYHDDVRTVYLYPGTLAVGRAAWLCTSVLGIRVEMLPLETVFF